MVTFPEAELLGSPSMGTPGAGARSGVVLQSLGLGSDEASLVSEDDELDSVSGAELGEDPRDVRLDRSFSHSEALTTSALERPCATSRRTSYSRGVRSESPRMDVADGGLARVR